MKSNTPPRTYQHEDGSLLMFGDHEGAFKRNPKYAIVLMRRVLGEDAYDPNNSGPIDRAAAAKLLWMSRPRVRRLSKLEDFGPLVAKDTLFCPKCGISCFDIGWPPGLEQNQGSPAFPEWAPLWCQVCRWDGLIKQALVKAPRRDA